MNLGPLLNSKYTVLLAVAGPANDIRPGIVGGKMEDW
jgi:hypothetical protein